ncbi:hypothetical protein ABHF91_03520 [Pseudaeromonas sp. ZJS20]|uniref:hypothetical protein n=1 Tax=Pseudaeromonas aegiceratis TaxID=3153928 RepID=UPI00390CAED8
MHYKHPLPTALRLKAAGFAEFATGGAQATVQLQDGRLFPQALISNGSAIIALRGYAELPFAVTQIADLFQSEADLNPDQRGGWHYWDTWQSPQRDE